jgi:hypothetical protein
MAKVKAEPKASRRRSPNGSEKAATTEAAGTEGLPLSAYPGWDPSLGGIRHDDPARRPRFRRRLAARKQTRGA